MKTRTLLALAGGAVLAAILLIVVWRSRVPRFHNDPALQAVLNGITNDYRQVIVLVDGADALEPALRARSIAAARMIFHRKHNALEELGRRIDADGIQQLIRY